MDIKSKPAISGPALTQYQELRAAARAAAESSCGGSPLAMEGTMAAISEEVTNEAIERRRRDGADR